MARIASTTSAGVQLPGGGMTLDALMARQKELAERQALNQQQGATTIPGGLAQMSNALFTGLAQRKAQAQEAESRQALAQLLSGISPETGATPEQFGQAYAIDPNLGATLMTGAQQARRDAAERADRIANREDMQEFQATQQTGQQEFTAGQQQTLFDQQTRLQNERLQAEQAASGAKPMTDVAKIEADFAAGRIDQATRDAAIAKSTTITSAPGSATDRKALWGQQDEYVNTSSAIGKLRRAQELLSQGIHIGPTAGARTWAGTAGAPFTDAEKAARTKEYNNIMTGEAIAAMSQQLAGATTNEEMARFISIMNDPSTPEDVKRRELDTMLARSQSFNELQASRIRELGGDVPKGPADTSGAGTDETVLLQQARDAIAQGADAALVRKRLVDKGIDPGKL